MKSFAKPVFVSTALVLTASIVVSAWSPAFAQARTANSMNAGQVAGLVQAFYDGARTIQSDFEQTYYYKLYNRYERSRGKVVFKKPGKMRWDYARPNGKVIVSDGRTLQVFDPGEPGETPQLFEQAMNEHQLPQAFSFLTGTGKLDDEFTFRLLDAERQGFRDGYVLELRPKKATPHYDRLLFYVQVVGEGAKQAGIVRRVMIVDPAGNRNRFDFKELRFNREVPDAQFRFRAPAGTRRVQP